MRRVSLAQAFLLIAAFLAPLIGGQINTETAALEPGLGALLRNIFSDADRLIAYQFQAYQPSAALNTPTLSHALIGLLTVASLLAVVAQRRVFQVPVVRVGGPLLAAMAWLVVTLSFSRFQSVSIVALCEWLIYGAAFFAVVACIGRRSGPVAFTSAIVLGCTILGLMGLWEYRFQGENDPTWRIFATWTPNSLAGILGIGLLLALGLCVYLRSAVSALPWCGGVCMFTALLLTGSRGGLLAAGVGLVVLAALTTFWSTDRATRIGNLIKIASCLALSVVLVRVVVLQATRQFEQKRGVSQAQRVFRLVQQPAAPAPTPFARMRAETGEQSGGFRINLWKGAAQLTKSNPVGTGIGTYRFSSAKSGLTTQTHLAHESYLQLGVEAGWIGLLFLPAFIVLWLVEMTRGAFRRPDVMSLMRAVVFEVAIFLGLTATHLLSNRIVVVAALTSGLVLWTVIELSRGQARVTEGQNLLRAGVIAAVAAVAVDNIFESGLYSFGIGWCFFAVLGLGMLLAVDGVAPELVPRTPKLAAIASAVLVSFVLLHGAIGETIRSRGRYERDFARDYVRAESLASTARSLSPIDGENWRLAASVTPSLYERGRDLQKAVDLHPTARNLRAYALFLTQQGDLPGAIAQLIRALPDDPNNLLTLSQLVEAYEAYQDREHAVETAKRIVAIEETPYFMVRSLPEIIPVETYAARAFLARVTDNPQERVEQLEKAVAGYQRYLATTMPMLRAMSMGDATLQFGGENLNVGRYKMDQAAQTAQLLVDTYKALKRPQDAARIQAIQKAFAAAAQS